jgi:hypothetical protein
MKIKHHMVTSVLLQIFLIHIALHVMIFKSEQSYSLTKGLHYFISVSMVHAQNVYCFFPQMSTAEY